MPGEHALRPSILPAVVIFLSLFARANPFGASCDAADAQAPLAFESKLFVAADESSEVVATFTKQERYVPLAETLGRDGARWYLIKIDSGATGWMKENDKEAAQKLESYFKPLSAEQSFPRLREVPSSSSGASPGNRISVPIETNEGDPPSQLETVAGADIDYAFKWPDHGDLHVTCEFRGRTVTRAQE